jgi:hypothetical protein
MAIEQDESPFRGFSKPVEPTIADLIFNYASDLGTTNVCFAPSQHTLPKPNKSAASLASKPIDVPLTIGLRLVNSAWNMFLIPRLYDAVHLDTTSQASLLFNTLSSTPNRRPLVRCVIVTIPVPNDIPDAESEKTIAILRRLFHRNLPCLRRLHLLTVTFMDCMGFLKYSLRGGIPLTHLTVRCRGPCVTTSARYLWSILLEFPMLEEFWFEFVGDDGAKAETLCGLPEGIKRPRLRKLRICGIAMDNVSIEKFRRVCVGSEEIVIERHNVLEVSVKEN